MTSNLLPRGYYTIAELASIFGVPTGTMRMHLWSKHVSTRKLGNVNVIKLSDVGDWTPRRYAASKKVWKV